MSGKMKAGWEEKLLSEICEVKDGTHDSPKYITEGIPFVTQKNIRNDGLCFANTKFITDIDHNKFYKRSNVTFGDILISMIGANRGMACIVDDKRVFSIKNVGLIKENEKMNKHFLLYYLKSSLAMRYVLYMSNGGAQEFIGLTALRSLPIPYPQLKEQQRIVALLDEAFAAIAQAKANAEQNLKNAKELFESYLQSVFENKGEGWINTSIGETCNLQTGGTPSTSKKEFYDGGSIKWLVSGDINQKIINDCEGRITELGMNSSNTKYLPVNSVLIALNGQGKTRGTVAMLKTKASCNQSLVSIYPKDDNSLLPELIFSNLEGRYEEIRRMTGDSGNDRRGLNMPLIRSIKFSYPKNLTDQEDIILKLDNLRTRTKQLAAIYQQKINDLDELKKSILQKAFAGELC